MEVIIIIISGVLAYFIFTLRSKIFHNAISDNTKCKDCPYYEYYMNHKKDSE